MNAEHQDSQDRHVWAVLPKLVALGDRDRTKRVRRSLWTWLIVVVITVTGIGVVVNWTLVERNPQDPVESWLQSMVDGRSRQGLATFSTGLGYDGASALPNRAYRAAGGRIDRWEITDVETNGTTGRVSAKVWWVDGEVPEGHSQGEEHTWNVVKEHRTGPFNDSWELENHESATLSVASPGLANITINGVSQRLSARDRATADGSGGLWTWEAMPGQFVVDLPENGDYVLRTPLDPVTVGLEDASDHRVTVEVEPSPNLWAEVDQAIAQKVDECMSATSVAPSGCPASQRWADGNVPNAQAPESPMATPTSATASPTALQAPTRGSSITAVEWELMSRPALWLIPDEDTGSQLDWKASEHTSAQARLTYVEDGRRVEETISFPVHVNVTSDGASADIEVRLD
ncbi:hypothetical protein [Kocuria sp.]|uniref:hypothetical protein n=1 Tax=Kocuria sp. TaxID=1871328 RepID=UPI0026E03297|nr:hypothetical protein [Kocuria sp.]MDO5618962.1 hypothetical protein [Kocuria sp.]